MANDHQMLTGYGETDLGQAYGMHGGIDIYIDGQGGQRVRAARAGTVVINNGEDGGYVVVAVPIGGGRLEYDGYMHVMNRVAPAVPAVGPPAWIEEGAPIGQISNTRYRAGLRHLHFEVQSALPPAVARPDYHNYRDPFLRFTADTDKDPLSNSPGLFDSNGDGRTLIIAASNTLNPMGVAVGDVDIIADVRDQMNNLNYIGASAPQYVGYYVRPLFVGTHGVKDATAPYLVDKLDDNWFADMPAVEANAEPIAGLIWPRNANMRVNPNPTGSPAILNTIVTNTHGTDGRRANVANEDWRTNARDDATANTVAHANFFGRAVAANNAQARFKDGVYEIHIVMGDVLTNVDRAAGRVLVSNFFRLPVIILGANAAPAPAGATTPLQTAAADADWIPDFQPTPTDASVATTFNVGDMVGVGGASDTNYYPDELMDIYVVPHRVWNEGDSLSTYAVHHSLVMSDDDGTLPETQAWVADNPGTYDLIVDYNNDGKFSWKLDGISSFTVLDPDNPTTVALDDSYSTLHDQTLTVSAAGVLANDYNTESSPLTATALSGPSHGTLTLNANGSLTYTPNSLFVGFDSFTYTATADNDTSATATVLIEVTNGLPSAADAAYNIQHDQTLTVTAASGVLAIASDPDGDSITAVLIDGPSNGSLTLNADGSFTYTPNSGFAGQDSFLYVTNDGVADSGAPAVVTIDVTNELPTAEPDSYSITYGQTLTVTPVAGVLANDSDPDGDPITAVLIDGPANGTLTLNADGSFTYLPNPGSAGTDSFTYIPDDGTYSDDDYYGASPVQVTITITKATPTVSVSDDSGTFNGTAFAATATVAGVFPMVDDTPADSLEGVSPTVTYYAGSSASGDPLSGAPTQAGTYTVVAAFSGSPDYTATSASTTFTISQQNPWVSVSRDEGMFTGAPFAATATVLTIDGQAVTTLEGVSLTLTYYAGTSATGTPLSGAPTHAGTYTVVAGFSGSTDYTADSASTTFTISQVAPTITLSASGGYFTGDPFPATASIAGWVAGVDDTPGNSLEGVALVLTYYSGTSASGTPLDGPPSDPGDYTVRASFGGSTDYYDAFADMTFTIYDL